MDLEGIKYNIKVLFCCLIVTNGNKYTTVNDSTIY